MNIGFSEDKLEDDKEIDIRSIIREELQNLLPTLVTEIYRTMPPEIVAYRNNLQSAKIHNEEPTRPSFDKEIEGHENRMKQHDRKYPEQPTLDRISNKGISLATQMGDRQSQIERIQRRHSRSKLL